MKRLILIGIIIAVFLATFGGGRAALMQAGLIAADGLKYAQEYIAGAANIKGNVDTSSFLEKSPDYDIGANKDGYAVFKDPGQALKRLKEDCQSGLQAIQEEFNLEPLNVFNLEAYKTYGWQLTSGTDKERQQGQFISQFLDIYENSFNRQH